MEENEKFRFQISEDKISIAVLHTAVKILAEARALMQLNCQILANQDNRDWKDIANKVIHESSVQELEILKNIYASYGSLPPDLPKEVTGLPEN